MIKSLNEKTHIEIDLTGPQGNAFSLIRFAMDMGKKINDEMKEEIIDVDALVADMTSSDYEHIVELLEENFGDHIILYR